MLKTKQAFNCFRGQVVQKKRRQACASAVVGKVKQQAAVEFDGDVSLHYGKWRWHLAANFRLEALKHRKAVNTPRTMEDQNTSASCEDENVRSCASSCAQRLWNDF
ncbi:uncharacterized protein LOC142576314 [Dermacentor variabilis]|uniref:uncharacterized protein LOC142576314 n=1 Tax=Dermacentor variabilis TaxID=34621 RepID=UPI003F5B202B